jgi:hypothetical protein
MSATTFQVIKRGETLSLDFESSTQEYNMFQKMKAWFLKIFRFRRQHPQLTELSNTLSKTSSRRTMFHAR